MSMRLRGSERKTHSPDAFVNNLHELQYHYRNADGRRLDILILAAFGNSGEVVVTCGTSDRQVVRAGTATNDLGGGSGARMVPSAACFGNVHPPYEDWLSDNHITAADGRTLAVFNPHFAVFNPARYFAPGLPQDLGRSVDRCRELAAPVRAECQYLRDHPNVAWDSHRSPFSSAFTIPPGTPPGDYAFAFFAASNECYDNADFPKLTLHITS
jgi:hypothetical protein